jgi:hypothetical protein
MSFTLWGTLSSFFGGSGLHLDRGVGGDNFGIPSPIWVDTSTSASGYSFGNSNTYSIVAEGQDTIGDEGPPFAIATTTMVFPFLTGSGNSSSFAAGWVVRRALRCRPSGGDGQPQHSDGSAVALIVRQPDNARDQRCKTVTL